MSSKQRSSPWAQTGLEWLSPSIKAWEIGWMAPQVMAYRMVRMMGGWPPTARDLREYTRMGQEKAYAFSQASQALTAAAMAPLTASPAATLDKTLAPIHRRVRANNRLLPTG